MRSNLLTAMETIGFQSKDFFSALTRAVEKVRSKRMTHLDDKEFYSSSEMVEISKIIKDYTGLKIDWSEWSNDGPAIQMACNMSGANHTHVFSGEDGFVKWLLVKLIWGKDDIQNNPIVLLNKKFLVGNIDRTNNRVEGDFCDIPNTLYFPKSELVTDEEKKAKLTSEECAAIILHEVGHAFGYLEYLDRSIRRNQILASVMLNYTTPEKEKKIFISKLENIYTLSEDEKKVFEDVSKANEAGIVIIRKEYERNIKELGGDVYDETSFEALADNYAVKCGAGKALASGLKKIMGAYNAGLYFQFSANFFNAVIKISQIFTLLTYGGILTVAIYVVPLLLSIFFSGMEEEQYDDLKHRFVRIRQGMIEQLKKINFPPKDIQEVLTQLDEIEKYINTTRWFDPNVLNYLKRVVNPKYRKSFNIKQLEQQLEGLISNDLFVSAAKLKQV